MGKTAPRGDEEEKKAAAFDLKIDDHDIDRCRWPPQNRHRTRNGAAKDAEIDELEKSLTQYPPNRVRSTLLLSHGAVKPLSKRRTPVKAEIPATLHHK